MVNILPLARVLSAAKCALTGPVNPVDGAESSKCATVDAFTSTSCTGHQHVLCVTVATKVINLFAHFRNELGTGASFGAQRHLGLLLGQPFVEYSDFTRKNQLACFDDYYYSQERNNYTLAF